MNCSLDAIPQPLQATWDVCPHCKRRLAVAYSVDCEGYAFPAVWVCPEHGAVPPMRSAVCNDAAYAPYATDWSSA